MSTPSLNEEYVSAAIRNQIYYLSAMTDAVEQRLLTRSLVAKELRKIENEIRDLREKLLNISAGSEEPLRL